MSNRSKFCSRRGGASSLEIFPSPFTSKRLKVSSGVAPGAAWPPEPPDCTARNSRSVIKPSLVNVEPVEVLQQARRRFFLGDLPIAIHVETLKSLLGIRSADLVGISLGPGGTSPRSVLSEDAQGAKSQEHG